MEATVNMSLRRYDELKERIKELEVQNKALSDTISCYRPFELKPSYDGKSLFLAPGKDAKGFISKEIAEYGTGYEFKDIKSDDSFVWEFGKKVQ
jgi:hypothetical protein